MMHRVADPPRRVFGRRIAASIAAALACAAATENTAVLTSRLLVDGAAVTALWSIAQLAIWLGRMLRRAIRAIAAA